MIPKIIHYCWFGKKKKPKLVIKCIESWKKHLPDYKIIEWNENNCDLSKGFTSEAYKLKKWAFVADVVRLEKLYEYGGVYLDTDMFLFKDINDLLINYCFLGTEDDELISCGIIGTIKENIFIKCCLEEYNDIEFHKDSNLLKISMPRIVTSVFREKYNFKGCFDDIVSIGDITIYSKEFFYSFPFESRNEMNKINSFMTENSYGVHLWSASWIQFNEFYYFNEGKYSLGIYTFFRNFNIKKIKTSYMLKMIRSIKILKNKKTS
ncbi:MAG: mannosyltransferase [Flavobacteriaceae bacterium]|nr:MAG: mannosyltransferase [Flavobacteriaceae bacterium]